MTTSTVLSQSPKAKWWKRLLVIGFAVGFGIVAGIAVIALIWYRYEQHKNRPTEAKTWPTVDIESHGIKVDLKTQWRDGKTRYKFEVTPRKPELLDGFNQIASSNTSDRSFTIHFHDTSDFELCSFEVGTLTRILNDQGIASGFEKNGGEYACSSEDYRQAERWNVTFRSLES